MDEEYAQALKEIKEAQKLKEEILKNIVMLPLPKGFSITFERQWIYPDGHIFKSERFGTRLCLRQNGLAVGLLNFGISPEKCISIHSIQGIKSNSKKKPPKDWAKLLTDTFILATLPKLYNGYTLQYLGQKELIGGKTYVDHFSKVIEELNSKNKDPERIKQIKKNLIIFEEKKKFIKILLGTYFDKDGYLNFNRLRTKTLKDNLNKIKLKIEKPKISPYKRRTLTKITRRI
ncbi:MAG: hypothetical protein WCX82_03120 [archaeon]|jgi:hypothetical protein